MGRILDSAGALAVLTINCHHHNRKGTMKAFIVIGALLLAGCTIERTVVQEPTTEPPTTQPDTTPAPTKPTSPPTTQPQADEQGFIDATHSKVPVTRGLSDRDLLDSGYATCEGFASGLTLEDVVRIISDSAEGDPDVEDMLQWVAVNAVVYLCPEFSYKMESA